MIMPRLLREGASLSTQTDLLCGVASFAIIRLVVLVVTSDIASLISLIIWSRLVKLLMEVLNHSFQA